MNPFPDLYPLTSLQIGNVKSSLSRAFLYFAPVSHKFLILVDNQSWRRNKHSRSTHIRELMITKYRMSPFRNTRTLLRSPSLGCRFSNHERKSSYRWLRAINMANLREKTPFSVMHLYKALHGFIVFEVAWKYVHGINYLSELQTDASLALEVKFLSKWEFHGIDQALSSISSWFSGTPSETLTLQSNLILLHNRVSSYSSRGITIASEDLLLNKASQAELSSEDLFFDVRECPIDTNGNFRMDHWVEEPTLEKKEQAINEDSPIEPMGYEDILLLFRFNDRDLPFKLKQIITSNIKLLALLEAGLPSWVIFLQSYPLFCKLYRPWFRPLFRTIYILISLITVIIGFYDLYKNIPPLKATVSHLCGPLFKWIEEWDMVSRMRYLGTMLLLQNFQSALKWFLILMRVLKPFASFITEPLIRPLGEMVKFVRPVWSIFAEVGEQFYSSAWLVLRPFYDMILELVEVFFSPLELLSSYVLSVVTLISPFFNSTWEAMLFPTRGCLLLANYVASIFSEICEMLLRFFMIYATNLSQLSYFAKVKPSSPGISFWNSLWNDLLSKVLRSLRNIVHGLVAFFSSCNRHRLSIYNHLREIIWRLCELLRLSPRKCRSCQAPQVETNFKVDEEECDRCK